MIFLVFLAKPCTIGIKTVAEIYGIYIKSVCNVHLLLLQMEAFSQQVTFLIVLEMT